MSNQAPDDQTAAPTTPTEEETAAAQQVLTELATSTVLLPQEAAPGEDVPENSVALPVIEQDGTQYIPVFTSEEGLRAAGADPETAIPMPLAELSANWPADDLWLAVDAGSENGLALPPELAQALAGLAGASQQ